MAVPKKPNNDQRHDKPKAKSDKKTGAVEDSHGLISGLIAGAFAVLAGGFGSIHNYSLMIIAICICVGSFAIAIYFHWPSKYRKAGLAVVLSVNFIGCELWLLDVVLEPSAPPSKPLDQSPVATPMEVGENRLTNFRVTKDSGDILDIEIMYYYGGSLGADLNADPISVSAIPLRDDGTPVNERLALTKIATVQHRTIAELRLTTAPRPPELFKPIPNTWVADITAAIQICLAHPTKGAFYCQTFQYKKMWNRNLFGASSYSN